MDHTSGVLEFTYFKKMNNSNYKTNDKSNGRLTWPYRATYRQYALHGLECYGYVHLQL